MESIKQLIFQLEKDLLKSEIRKSSQKIKEIIANDFIEITSSGSEYYYKDGDIFQEVNDNCELIWEIMDYKVKRLSDDCILAIYKVIKHSESDERKKYSLRSSIWKYYDGKWKLVFHQGTLTSEI